MRGTYQQKVEFRAFTRDNIAVIPQAYSAASAISLNANGQKSNNNKKNCLQSVEIYRNTEYFLNLIVHLVIPITKERTRNYVGGSK